MRMIKWESTISLGLCVSERSCWSKDSVWSSVTPSNFTVSDKCTEELATVIPWVPSIVDSRCRVPKITGSVLSGLSRSAFCRKYSDTASEHSVSEDRRTLSLLVASTVYNIKSSAYWWYWIPREQMTSSIGDTYSANRSDPRMEPCGTPDDRMAVLSVHRQRRYTATDLSQKTVTSPELCH